MENIDLIARLELSHIKLGVIAGVGHTMGPEPNGRVDPIDKRVLDEIARWLDEHFAVH